jgi:hypothetical protein
VVQDDLPRYGTRLAVRLDSAAQRAILEVRSSETGEVVNQYPSEAQMRAFQQAARLESAQAERRQAAVAAQAAAFAKAPGTESSSAVPEPRQMVAAERPTPEVSVGVGAEGRSARQGASPSAGDGESVLV